MLIKSLHAPGHLLNAWNQLNKSNPESFGLSLETISTFKSQIDLRIPIISEQILKGQYKFSDTRASVIPKDNGKFRPLQIPEVQDRLVLKAIAIILESCLANVLKDGEGVSFAYQKGKGIHDAILKMKEYYNTGRKYILEADIVNFALLWIEKNS